MPASYALLCAFIGKHKGRQAGGTIRTWMSSIHSWHLVNHTPWYGNDDWVQLARTSANKEGMRHKRPLRAPVSIEHLTALYHSINLSNPFHAAVWAVATCTFFSCQRLGETTVSTAASFDTRYHVLCSTPITFCELRNSTRSAHFPIPWTKPTKEQGATVILTARNDFLCPCTALHNHLAINASVPPTVSLFTYCTGPGQWKNMLKDNFLTFITNIWTSALLTHVLGHSSHIGSTVELLLASVPPEIVAVTGGWTSLTFLLYWWRMKEILPMSTSKAYKKSHLDELATIFENFHTNNRIPEALLTTTAGNLTL
jgi:hypothetical protein